MVDDLSGRDAARAAQFHALALPHLDDAYTLARYLTGDRADAEDAVQECFLRALRYFHTFQGGAIKPWLFAILRNVCRSPPGDAAMVYAGDADERTLGVARVVPLWHEETATPEALLLRQRDDASVREMIGALPPEFREVVVLREIHDLSYREIATVIDAPIGTVMSRLARGRDLLRAAWTARESRERP